MPKITDLDAAAAVAAADTIVLVSAADGKTRKATVGDLPSGGGTVPTGTGFTHITAGAQDAAAKLVTNADVDAAAAIALSKIANPTGTGVVKTTAGAIDAASSLIVNADVDAAAAVAGTKIAPDFGAQTVQTTGVMQAGSLQFSASSIATAGLIRLSGAANYACRVRDAADTANLTGIYIDGSDALNIGTDNTFATAQQMSKVRIYAAGSIEIGRAGATIGWVDLNGLGVYYQQNLGIFGAGFSFPSVGGGVGVFGIGNAATTPTSTPTGGGVLYATAGALHWRGSSGTDTAVAPAEPHCPRCGTDVGVSGATNDIFGEEMIHCHSCELRTGNGVVVHVVDFFERRKAA